MMDGESRKKLFVIGMILCQVLMLLVGVKLGEQFVYKREFGGAYEEDVALYSCVRYAGVDGTFEEVAKRGCVNAYLATLEMRYPKRGG
tara:strand:- start:346 stop:609 length:264 start_codon:yes stop_codon:yes gene_type:complete